MNRQFVPLVLGALVVTSACKKDDNPDPDEDGRTLANLNLVADQAWGTSMSDDFAGAVLDNTGTVYFAAARQPDGYQGDIMVVKTDGSTVSWAKRLDAGNQDYFPSPSENGHSQGGGGSRCIAADATGGIYVAGASEQGFYETFVVKYNSTGNIQWQIFWEADNSGLAKGNAKAYAIDVAGGKVFVTGTTGAGIGQEESHIFLLVLDANTGAVLTETNVGIDPSPGYNDRGYSVRSPDGNSVYIAGWEGQSNSGILLKFSNGGTAFNWYNKINIGWAGRLTDIDFDASGNLYLAADIRGVNTSMGVIKCDPNGGVLWSKQYYGLNNDRNNISCVRVINGHLYVGGRGSFDNYDSSTFGDGTILKVSLAGELEKVYNYFTQHDNDKCGERIEALLHDGTNFIVMGETWPEYSMIQGNWYVPSGTWTNLTANSTISTTCTVLAGTGATAARTFSEYTMTESLYSPATNGSRGSADIRLWKIANL
jgi:hypothetical protein